MSLAKLTSISTQTLTLLLERQRLQTLPTSPSTSSTLHLRQIAQNLHSLRAGIITLQSQQPGADEEALELLKAQYERMRGMLGENERAGIESLEVPREPSPPPTPSPESPSSLPSPSIQDKKPFVSDQVFEPYTDDPDADVEQGMLLQSQRRLMDEQDVHLDRLSHSINRQRDISLQINEELDVHTGILDALDTDLDHTSDRLTGARRQLARVAKGVKGNGSTVTIALLILVLLILIVIFKT